MRLSSVLEQNMKFLKAIYYLPKTQYEARLILVIDGAIEDT